ncbi:MAG: hypothetical protein FJ096_21295 [Deltaproteobacteria bacterium]|nr:hypothetical protein [Deltaproteobacteria bacterium]
MIRCENHGRGELAPTGFTAPLAALCEETTSILGAALVAEDGELIDFCLPDRAPASCATTTRDDLALLAAHARLLVNTANDALERHHTELHIATGSLRVSTHAIQDHALVIVATPDSAPMSHEALLRCASALEHEAGWSNERHATQQNPSVDAPRHVLRTDPEKNKKSACEKKRFD